MSTDKRLFADAGTEMGARRTGMAFQRTRMAQDRTLMAVIRTSLSLISFGFTINQFFEKLVQAKTIATGASAQHFGISLAIIGILMLVLGIVYHFRFMRGLRDLRQSMTEDGLIYGQSEFPPSLTFTVAVVLLLLGLAAIYAMIFHVRLF